MNWLIYALITVVCWGLYGAFLGKGAAGFGHDRMKAFLFVGVAYFLIAIIGPLLVMLQRGEKLDLFSKPDGLKLSLFAGVLGAVGAFTALFALSAHPLSQQKLPAMAASQVMSVIFAGAPVVAAVYGLVINPPKDGIGSVDWRFAAGLVFAAAGGALVTLYKPS
jgi:hypothetical protein